MTTKLERLIDQGIGRVPADIVLKGGCFFDLVTGELVQSDIAICGDRIVGTCGNYDGRNRDRHLGQDRRARLHRHASAYRILAGHAA